MRSNNNSVLSEYLNGKVALVTGGSRGIGRSTCLALAARGAAVVVHYNTKAEAAQSTVATVMQEGGRAVALQANLGEPSAVDELVKRTIESFGSVSILINNAAIMTDTPVETMSDEVWEHSLNVNLSATFRCIRACIPSMKQNRWGRIINVSSQAAYTGSREHAHYAAAKAALLGLTYSLAKELGREEITANVLVPGRIATDMLLERIQGREEQWLEQTPLGRLGRPEEVAAAVAFLASPAASYITGAALHVGGGLVMG